MTRPRREVMWSNRRAFLQGAASAALAPWWSACATTSSSGKPPLSALRRVRPSDREWPSAADWQGLNHATGGRLMRVQSPLDICRAEPGGEVCRSVLERMRNPYYIGDDAGLTQTSGWSDAWVSSPSTYAVKAETTEDVVAAVNFAREHDLRLVVKGGGHSYQGTSNAPDSLLIWTRAMNAIALHDGFIATGCEASQAPQAAATIGAGAMWIQAYDAVTTRAGRYVQGGGCATVGVAGLIQSGGFGSFSKAYGIAAAGLLEAEVVTADGVVRTTNACTHPDLFWALKGGGGGTFGVVTRVTLKTRELPALFGAVNVSIRAKSNDAYLRLIARTMQHCAEQLLNPHWGEQLVFTSDNLLRVSMLFQGLAQRQAEGVWRSFIEGSTADGCTVEQPFRLATLPAQRLWDPEFLRRHLPGSVVADDRPDAPAGNIFWAGDRGQVGQFVHGFRSAWLPAGLLEERQRGALAKALFACTRHWDVSLHLNKGLAGATQADVDAARDTAVNPAALDAFALAIIAGEGPFAIPGVFGLEPNARVAHEARASIDAAMRELLRVAPDAGSYVAESDFFEPNWQRSHWGANYERLMSVKRRYDPSGLFFVHHGVGSEAWSADGFTRTA